MKIYKYFIRFVRGAASLIPWLGPFILEWLPIIPVNEWKSKKGHIKLEEETITVTDENNIVRVKMGKL